MVLTLVEPGIASLPQKVFARLFRNFIGVSGSSTPKTGRATATRPRAGQGSSREASKRTMSEAPPAAARRRAGRDGVRGGRRRRRRDDDDKGDDESTTRLREESRSGDRRQTGQDANVRDAQTPRARGRGGLGRDLRECAVVRGDTGVHPVEVGGRVGLTTAGAVERAGAPRVMNEMFGARRRARLLRYHIYKILLASVTPVVVLAARVVVLPTSAASVALALVAANDARRPRGG